MTDKHKQRVKRFGDKMAKDDDVSAHVITVFYKNGDIENNWSGIDNGHSYDSAPFLLEDDDE